MFLLCVVEEVHPHLPDTEYYNTMRKQINEQLHEKAAAVLQRFSDMLAAQQVRASVWRDHGYTAHVLSHMPVARTARHVLHRLRMRAGPSPLTAPRLPSAPS